MTTETTETTTEDTVDDGSGAQHDHQNPEAETTEETAGTNREAKYRRQLRDTEAERDGLVGQLDAMRRAEAERIAANVIAEPAALWAADVQLEDLLGDAGTVDAEKVTAAARDAQERLGLQQRLRNAVPKEGANQRTSSSTTFADAFAPH